MSNYEVSFFKHSVFFVVEVAIFLPKAFQNENLSRVVTISFSYSDFFKQINRYSAVYHSK